MVDFVGYALISIIMYCLYKRYRVGLLKLKTRHKLLSLRDRLRLEIIEEQEVRDYAMYDYLETAIDNAIKELNEINILGMTMFYYRNRMKPDFKQKIQIFNAHIKLDSGYSDYFNEFVSTMTSYTVRKDRFQSIMIVQCIYLYRTVKYRSLHNWTAAKKVLEQFPKYSTFYPELHMVPQRISPEAQTVITPRSKVLS